MPEKIYEDENLCVFFTAGEDELVCTFSDATMSVREDRFFADVPLAKLGKSALGFVA